MEEGLEEQGPHEVLRSTNRTGGLNWSTLDVFDPEDSVEESRANPPNFEYESEPIIGLSETASRTTQFWERYYTVEEETASSSSFASQQKDSSSKEEWILQDTPAVLDTILDALPPPRSKSQSNQNSMPTTTVMRILEIGCGTSRLSRSLLEHLIWKREHNPHNNNNNNRIDEATNHHGSNQFVSYDMTATDVSGACIQRNTQRDLTYMDSFLSDQESPHRDKLCYETLDIVGNVSSLPQHMLARYNCILDKGCLDTFLYRASSSERKSRGNTTTTMTPRATTTHSNHRAYPPVLLSLLDNVHSLLNEGGRYIIITPRGKIKSVRDFAGFQHVQRICIDAHQVGKGLLGHETTTTTATSNTQNDTNKKNDDKKKMEMPQKKEVAYMHICTVNSKYRPQKDDPFPNVVNTSLQSDTTTCPKCGITFHAYRNGELGKETYWSRRWNGHMTHCKGSSEDQ
uniref:Methyltransferase domain-containing protein n=1 Tax=Attheya septentrionalis TaxID=420275 RepID=A0A7S2XQA9_9STRA|mmetsp:Transcript_26662/g.48408  ORF Transcript_26662/g.48408 Transcript_26662/m.48408 type:complete len:457 (+) Transcript_26662:707-2077(+)